MESGVNTTEERIHSFLAAGRGAARAIARALGDDVDGVTVCGIIDADGPVDASRKGVLIALSSEKSAEQFEVLMCGVSGAAGAFALTACEYGRALNGCPQKIVVLPAADAVDLLRVFMVGVRGGHEQVERIRDCVANWQASYGAAVVGIAHNWLKLRFDDLPPHMAELNAEVLEIFPEDGDVFGTLDTLASTQILEIYGL